MRRYIIIVSLGDKRVISIVESPVVNKANMRNVSERFSRHWLASSTQYPSPDYDIITGVWADQTTAQKSVGQYFNWESAQTVSLSV